MAIITRRRSQHLLISLMNYGAVIQIELLIIWLTDCSCDYGPFCFLQNAYFNCPPLILCSLHPGTATNSHIIASPEKRWWDRDGTGSACSPTWLIDTLSLRIAGAIIAQCRIKLDKRNAPARIALIHQQQLILLMKMTASMKCDLLQRLRPAQSYAYSIYLIIYYARWQPDIQ